MYLYRRFFVTTPQVLNIYIVLVAIYIASSSVCNAIRLAACSLQLVSVEILYGYSWEWVVAKKEKYPENTRIRYLWLPWFGDQPTKSPNSSISDVGDIKLSPFEKIVSGLGLKFLPNTQLVITSIRGTLTHSLKKFILRIRANINYSMTCLLHLVKLLYQQLLQGRTIKTGRNSFSNSTITTLFRVC